MTGPSTPPASAAGRPRPGTVLVVGEALVDVVRGHATPGGSPANVAVGLARLEVPVELTSRFGTDVYGVLLARHLAVNGVRLASGTVDPTTRTATATATLDADGVASYEFDIDWRPPPLRLPDDCAAVHTGSIATVLAPGSADVRTFVRGLAGAPVTVFLDPNARPTITPDGAKAWAAVTDLAAYADLVKLSDEDCAFLQPDRTPEQVAAELLANGGRTRCVVITLGGDGALGITAAGAVRVPAPRIEVVDTVGAGDSFMSALIAGLHQRDLLGTGRLTGLEPHLKQVLATATRAAAITCMRPGADPPTLAELA
jgi:fructokinase